MASFRKNLEKRAGFFAFNFLGKIFLKKTPLQAELAGEKLGRFVYLLSKKHRNRALSNLEMAYPEMPEAERVALAKRCFEHFGRVFADFLRASTRTTEELESTCTVKNFEILDEALKQGHGAIIITGHFGNWERAAHLTAARGYPLWVVARDANDSDLNRAVMATREAQGLKVLSRGAAARGILSNLKKNECIAILPDQNSSDIYIPFFGKPAGTVTGPSAIAVKTGSPMIPMFCRYVGRNQYEIFACPPLVPVEGYDPVEGITRAMNNQLEAVIRENPEQWLWFHDRWKNARRAGLL